MPPWPGSVRRRTRTTLRRPERGPRGRRQRGRGAYAARAPSQGTPEHRRIGGAISSHTQPLPVLAPARAAPEPTLGDARHDAPAVRTPLIVAPAPEEAEPDRERRADHQRWGEDGLHDKHASRGSRGVKHGGARRRPGHRRMEGIYFSFSRSSLPSFSDSACLPSLCSCCTIATLSLTSAAVASSRVAAAAVICATSFGHWKASAWPAAKTTATATTTSVIRDRCMESPPFGIVSGQLYEDHAALDPNRITRHLNRRVVDVGADRDVPAPGVPGAGYHAPVELALTQRPAPVGARVVDRVVGAVYVEQGQRLPLDLNHLALARRQVADGGDLHPSRLYHRALPYSITPRRPL